MDDDDDAWSVPTTTMQEATSVHREEDADGGYRDFDDEEDFDDARRRTVEEVGGQRWVKVFGFTNLDVVLEEFEKVGKIERYEPAAGSGNWVLIKFARDFLQQFALEKDKQVIGSGSEQCMIGVVPWSAEEQAAEEAAQGGGGGGGAGIARRLWRPHGLNRLHPVVRQTPQKGPNRRKPRRPPTTLCERIMRCIFG